VENSGKKIVGILIGIGTVLIVFLFYSINVGMAMISAQKREATSVENEIVLNDYITMKAEGYDGFGEVKLIIDEKRFINDQKDKIRLTDELKKRMKKNGLYKAGVPYDWAEDGDEAAVELFMEYVFDEIAISNNHELSNGDTVVLSWSPDLWGKEKAQTESLFGVKIAANDITMRVEGLKEIPTFDPFEEYELVLSGCDGYGRVKIVTGYEDRIHYEADSASGLSNGDEVTVTASYLDYRMTDKEYFRMFGEIPRVWQKTFRISTLPKHLQTMEWVSPQSLTKLHEKAEEVIFSGLDDDDGIYTADVRYAGYSFAVRENENYMTLIYEVDYDGQFEDYMGRMRTCRMKYYYYVQWEDVGIEEDGTLVCDPEEVNYSRSNLKLYSSEDFGEWVYANIDGHKTWKDAKDEAISRFSEYGDWTFTENKFQQ